MIQGGVEGVIWPPMLRRSELLVASDSPLATEQLWRPHRVAIGRD